MERVSELCKLAVGLEPHLTIYLDIDPEVGLARAKRSREQDRIEAETLGFHRKIREAYLKICHEHKSRFHLIDASQSPEAVYKETIQRIDILLKD
jgi:dTMP kinase